MARHGAAQTDREPLNLARVFAGDGGRKKVANHEIRRAVIFSAPDGSAGDFAQTRYAFIRVHLQQRIRGAFVHSRRAANHKARNQRDANGDRFDFGDAHTQGPVSLKCRGSVTDTSMAVADCAPGGSVRYSPRGSDDAVDPSEKRKRMAIRRRR